MRGALLVGIAIASVLGALLASPEPARADPRASQGPRSAVSAPLDAAAAPDAIPRGLRSPRSINAVKAGVATATFALLVAGTLRERRARVPLPRLGRAALAILGLLGAACWWNLFQFHYPGFGHPSDTFHYYLGAKYFPELGYTGLYACVAVADAETGVPAASLALRPMRNLETNRLETAAASLAEPGRCKKRFSDERWRAFRHDVAGLRVRVNDRRWKRFQQDHGYNATPVWTLTGHAVTNTGPVSDVQLAWIRALDPLLLVGMWGALAWAFGWPIAAMAAVFWGTNAIAPYGWTGGSILRQDWLAATALGIALLRRGYPASAGAALTTAALLRIFPAFAVLGIGLAMLGTAVAHRRLVVPRELQRFIAGCAGTLCVLFGAASVATGGPSTWLAFAENSQVHLSTPLANHVGLKTILSYDHDTRTEKAFDASLDDPMERWKDARTEQFAGRRWLFSALVLGFAFLVARAGRDQPLWVAAVLGVALIPVALELTGYYASVLLVLACIDERKRGVGALMCGLAALGWSVSEVWHWTDQIHVWLSVLNVVACLIIVLWLTPRPAASHP